MSYLYIEGMDLRQASDDVLMHAIQQQKLDALEELYDRHHRTALAVAQRVLGERSLAEDVIQETFLAVWRQASLFKPELGTPRSWLLSIARHRAIDVTRGPAFARRPLSLDQSSIEPRYPDAWQQVDKILEEKEVKEAIESLPPEQGEVIVLAYFEGRTQRDIAERTGVPLGTIKGRMRLGMQKLRAIFLDIEKGEGD